jgi:hypothetical protein
VVRSSAASDVYKRQVLLLEEVFKTTLLIIIQPLVEDLKILLHLLWHLLEVVITIYRRVVIQ